MGIVSRFKEKSLTSHDRGLFRRFLKTRGFFGFCVFCLESAPAFLVPFGRDPAGVFSFCHAREKRAQGERGRRSGG